MATEQEQRDGRIQALQSRDDEIDRLRAENEKTLRDYFRANVAYDRLRAENERLRAAWLAQIMAENQCYSWVKQIPCESPKCACLLEMQSYIGEQKARLRCAECDCGDGPCNWIAE